MKILGLYLIGAFIAIVLAPNHWISGILIWSGIFIIAMFRQFCEMLCK